MKHAETHPHITVDYLCSNLETVLDKVEQGGVGFVIDAGDGKGSVILCPITEYDAIHSAVGIGNAECTPLSEKIGCLLDALCVVQQIYAESNAKVTHLEHLTQDYLHALELEAGSYHERARIATALKQCREERRPYKDNVYLTESVAAYLKSKEGQKLLGRLEFLQNLARNSERIVLGKKYSPRVLTKTEYKNVAHKLPTATTVVPEEVETARVQFADEV